MGSGVTCARHHEAEKAGADGTLYIVCDQCGETLRRKVPERLAAAAIRRDGKIESRGFKEHWRIRAALGDENPHDPRGSDENGFLTDGGRFVTRAQAAVIGHAAGQVRAMGRELLSCDVEWDAYRQGKDIPSEKPKKRKQMWRP